MTVALKPYEEGVYADLSFDVAARRMAVLWEYVLITDGGTRARALDHTTALLNHATVLLQAKTGAIALAARGGVDEEEEDEDGE